MRSEILHQRANLTQQIRNFFTGRGFLEVDTPLLAREVIPELHINPKRGQDSFQKKSPDPFLMASPEMHMKMLLCAGATAIFQVTRSFRAGEFGPLHRPEFAIVEWYRTGDDMQAGIDLVDEFVQDVAGVEAADRKSYADAFREHVDVDPHRAACEELAAAADRLRIPLPEFDRNDRDEWLNLLLATRVESQLGADRPLILYDYPVGQSALARIETDGMGREVARRFELYWKGVELANGYDELTSADELRRRLQQVNADRVAQGGEALPLPERLLSVMEDPGLPACSGCALGFDRLLMLVTGAATIDEVMHG